MVAGDPQREDLLAELLAELDEQLADGTADGSVDTSAIAGDDQLAADWEADRRCLELLDRVRRRWSPDEPSGDTTAPDVAAVATPIDFGERTLGRFHVLRELGHGGLGIVYLAYDPKLRRQVALKVPRLEALANSDVRRRFLREAEAAARLSHPHLVAVHDFGEEGPLCYIAAEFCPGPTLAQWLKQQKRPAPIDVAVRMVRQLADAVGHAHGRGVLHRDIKPSNVLLDRREAGGGRREEKLNRREALHKNEVEDDFCPLPLRERAVRESEPGEGTTARKPRPLTRLGRDAALRPSLPLPQGEREKDRVATATEEGLCPKLTDFGMAKLLEREGEETRSGALVGTPAYMAPEQARGQVRELDARTDVYGLGAILYEVLTGRRVFESASDIEALRQVLFEEPVSPRKLRPEIPRDLEAICLKCLSKSSDARYATAQQLGDDLDRFLAGKPTEARPPSAAGRLWKWARRRPAMAALVSVIAAAAVTLFGVVVAYNARLTDEVTTSRQLLYTADVRVAYETWKANNVVQALEILDRQNPRRGEEDLREFAWYYLHEHCEPDTVNLTGHRGDVFAVAWSPDGLALATAGKDGTARIWDVETGKLLLILRGHSDEVTSVAFSPDGKTLASGSEDGTIRLWTVANGEAIHTLKGHSDHVLTVAFSPDGRHLASGGRDMTVRIWERATGAQIATFKRKLDVIRAVAFAPSGNTLFAVDEEGDINAWETVDWQHVGRTHLPPVEPAPGERLFALAVLPDERVAVAGRKETIWICESSADGGKVVQQLMGGHKEWIQSLAYSSACGMLASAGKAGVIQLWDLTETNPSRTLLGHKDQVWSAAWSPDGKRLASAGADAIVKIWSMADTAVHPYGSDAESFTRPVFFSDSATIALTESNHLGFRILDAIDCSVVARVDVTRRRGGFQAELSPDNELIAVRGGNKKNTLNVWRLPASELILELPLDAPGAKCLAWAPDGHRLAYSVDLTTVVLRNFDSGEIEQRFANATPIDEMVFTADGRHLATTSQSLDVWNVRTGRIEYSVPVGHDDVVTARDRSLIAAATGPNVTLVDMTRGRPATSTLVTIGSEVNYLAIHGSTLAVALHDPVAVSLWDVRTRQLLMRLDCALEEIDGLAFSPDGRRLVAAGCDAERKGCIWEWTIRK